MEGVQLVLSDLAVWAKQNAASLLDPLATLVATFVGARLAFSYQEKIDERKQSQSRRDAANRVLFQFAENVNFLKLSQIQLIDPFRDNPGRMLAMKPSFFSNPQTEIDVDSVSFLLSIGCENLLGEISIECRSFQQVVSLEAERSRLYLEKVNPALESSGIVNGQEVTDVQVRRALGEVNFFMLQELTDHYVNAVDSTLRGHLSVSERFRMEMLKAFPGQPFVKINV